ncbi:hypothetical protein DFH28DRAFT_1061525, partial [Melampsora americana]
MDSDSEASQDNEEPACLVDLESDPDGLASEKRQRTLIELWTKDHTAMFRTPSHSVNSNEDRPIERHPDDHTNTSDDEDPISEHSEDQSQCEEGVDVDDSSWAPFSNLEQLVGLLVLGTTRTTLSLLEYERIRLFVGFLGVRLPGYKSLKKTRQNLKNKYNFSVSETLSPLEKPCFGLKVKDILRQASKFELANPYVRDHLQFLPELPASGTKINRFSQSKKWRERLDPTLRVQMVHQDDRHFYIYEPVQLQSKKIVIPLFFYQSGADTYAKCVFTRQKLVTTSSIQIEFQRIPFFDSDQLSTINVNQFWREFDKIEIRPGILMKDHCGEVMYAHDSGSSVQFPLYNEWRKKADGRIIRHVPLILYCDDLSGNVSKRWNKHIAFYFTLAGLPSKLSNQEYNCHFLSTSNTAGALELADPLIDELNNLITEGFVAYDEKIQKEVFVMTVVLCHLGDSPMHAEVTNTMNPTTSLTPCRICNLKVQSLMDKRSSRYICDFLGIDETGNKSLLQRRDSAKTVQGTKDLWNLAQRPGNISQFDTKSAELGLRDSLNMSFVKMVQDFHQDRSMSSSSVEDICRDLNEQFQERLFNPFSRLKGFDGHCDTPVEVLHVILLGVGKYLMRNQMNSCSGSEKDSIRGRWRSFNTSGLNIPPIQPKTMIQHFMSLNGKEFRAVLQAAPFIFFELNILAEERATWIALAHLAPYIFQTEITNIDLYLRELACLIEIFLKSIVELTAQWCNKPKFHMLIH